MRTLDTSQVHDRIKDGKARLLDVRPVDAYNGWRMRGEARGGHIAGAKSLPAKWLGYLDWPDIVQSKGIVSTDELVVYGYDDANSRQVAERLQRLGFQNTSTYEGFLAEWCVDDSLPMSRLERYDRLVPAGWVNELLSTGSAPECSNDRHVVCHAHYRNKSAYDKGHIPGAVQIDTNELESTETWNPQPPDQLKKALESIGITQDTTVVLYGRFAAPDNNDPFPGSSAGHLGAIRCAFIMMYAGVKDVRVLNGGLQAWLDAGLETVSEETERRPVKDFGTAVPQNPELIVDISMAKRMLQDPNSNLVSVRSWREIIGEVSGYNYIAKKGRIPGAVFGNCGTDAYHMENYRNVDHTTREFHEIEKMWADAGITPDQHNAFYCGTGWRGSEAFFNAWIMGWPRIAVYDGGWFEWSNDERNPYETGVPEWAETTG